MITINLPDSTDERFLKFIIWVKDNADELLNSDKKAKEIWNKFRKKENLYHALKELLAENQGFVCCYCGSPINKKEQSDIEHLKPKSKDEYKNLIFATENLFVSCSSGDENSEYIVNPKDLERFGSLQAIVCISWKDTVLKKMI